MYKDAPSRATLALVVLVEKQICSKKKKNLFILRFRCSITKTTKMPRRKGKGKAKESKRHDAASTSSAAPTTTAASAASSSSIASPDPFLEEGPLEEFERVITFDDPGSVYQGSSSTDPWASSSSSAAQGKSPVATARGVKSDSSLELKGPLEVEGSVRSMGYITLDGDFEINGSVEAYGNVVVNGNMICRFVILLGFY